MVGDGLLDLAGSVCGDGYAVSGGGDHRHRLGLAHSHSGPGVLGNERRLYSYDVGLEIVDDLAKTGMKPGQPVSEVCLTGRGESVGQSEGIIVAVGVDGANAHLIGSGVYAEYEQGKCSLIDVSLRIGDRVYAAC